MAHEPTKSMKNIRSRVVWENLIKLPLLTLLYGVGAGGFVAIGLILIDGGWEPAERKYLGFIGFVLIGLGWGIVGGIQNYLMLKKLYREKWKEE